MLAGMEKVHEAGDAVRAAEDRKRSRQENRERVRAEMLSGAERLEELERLAEESGSGSELRSGTLKAQEEALEEARKAEGGPTTADGFYDLEDDDEGIPF